MEIRRFAEGDEEALWRIYYATTRESNARDYHPKLIERWAPKDKDTDEWGERIREKRPFVAEVEGEPVGFAELEESGYIDYFYVLPKYQGRGVGKELMSRVESEAGRLGLPKIYANVSVTAKPFFLSRGFAVTESRDNVILGLPAPNFAMEKLLHP